MMAVTVAQLIVKIGADISDATKGIDGVTSKVQAMDGQISGGLNQAATSIGGIGSKMQAMGSQMVATGGMLTLGITAPLMLIGKHAVSVAADFETSMNVLAESSDASADEVTMLSTKAKALGADLTLPGTSASDAAQAMLELSKAGLAVNQVMDASKGVLQLSAAGQISNAEAAQVTANALNMFRLSGGDAVMVADMLAAAANGSSASVQEMAQALSMGGSAAQQYGVDIDDFTTELALMANAGIKGSDAGTSLKTMFSRLGAPTDEAKAALKDLHIEIYDGSGKMRSQRDLIADFSTKLGGMTQESRNAAIQTIFGADAMRAANIVLAGGVEAYDKMNGKVNEAGSAALLADAQMKGMGGALAQMQSAADDASLALGTALAPTVTLVADAITKLTQSFTALDPQTQTAIANIGLVAVVIGPVIVALGSLVSAVGTLTTILPALGAGLAIAGGPVTLAVAAVLALSGGLFYLGNEAYTTADAVKFFHNSLNGQSAKIKTVEDAVKAYNEELKKTKKYSEEAGFGFKLLGGEAQVANAALGGFIVELNNSSLSYEDYVKAATKAAEATGYTIVGQDLLQKQYIDGRETVATLATANIILTKSEYENMQQSIALHAVRVMSTAEMDAETTAMLARLPVAEASKKSIEDLAKASADAAKAAGELMVAHVNLGQSLSNRKTNLDTFKQAILDSLVKTMGLGGEAADKARQSHETLSKGWGLLTNQGLLMADMVPVMVSALDTIYPSATFSDKAMLALVNSMGDGVLTIAEVKKSLGGTDEQAAKFIKSMDDSAKAADAMKNPATVAGEAIKSIKDGVESITPESIKGFTAAMGTLGQDMGGAAAGGAVALGDAMTAVKDGLEAITVDKISGIKTALTPLGDAMMTVVTKGAGPLASAMATIKAGLVALSGESVQASIKGIGDLGAAMTQAMGTGGMDAGAGATGGALPVDVSAGTAPPAAAGLINTVADGQAADAGGKQAAGGASGVGAFAKTLGMIKSSLEGIAVGAKSVKDALPPLGDTMEKFRLEKLDKFNEGLKTTLKTYMEPIDKLIKAMTKPDIPNLGLAMDALRDPTLSELVKAMDGVTKTTIPDLRDAFSKLANSIQEAINKALTLINLLGKIPGGLGGGGGAISNDAHAQLKQFGGQVLAGSPYIVGERGPELFVPAGNGMIVPNGQSGGGRSMVINNYFHDTEMDDEQFMRCLLRAERMGTI